MKKNLFVVVTALCWCEKSYLGQEGDSLDNLDEFCKYLLKSSEQL